MTPKDLKKLAQLVADKILDEFDARVQQNFKPMTPKGVETLEIFKPLGLSQEASTLPTGSWNDLISAKVSHIA